MVNKANAALDKMAENARELGLDYEPAQEPVAWVCEGSSSDEKHAIDYWPGDVDDLPIGTQLYAHPQAREPLTDEEIRDALEAEFLHSDGKRNWHDDLRVARAIEAKLREKNT